MIWQSIMHPFVEIMEFRWKDSKKIVYDRSLERKFRSKTAPRGTHRDQYRCLTATRPKPAVTAASQAFLEASRTSHKMWSDRFGYLFRGVLCLRAGWPSSQVCAAFRLGFEAGRRTWSELELSRGVLLLVGLTGVKNIMIIAIF